MQYYVHIIFNVSLKIEEIGFLCDKVTCTDKGITCHNIHLLNQDIEKMTFRKSQIRELEITGKDRIKEYK